MTNTTYRFEIWHTNGDPDEVNDLGEPMLDGWYCTLLTPDDHWPANFGPYPTEEEALAATKKRIAEVDSVDYN